ncbi:predicted protein [Sclerotinia sclerotiorum 1980 UF-70]|uniref:Uncharacterized protein n=1 Tax=Sclerotinia sclerotiorum (strain ATCC 18683 / 1980 / Ss-1) TaxID=665079 RepID=A7F0G2_SCLS1|nr:predicted protein [Sclerotinia sclerotiorum 1980 UF-70]EDN95204.1 predicted protein [Sclerotinia sclerotiorum 1980 UF-70]
MKGVEHFLNKVKGVGGKDVRMLGYSEIQFRFDPISNLQKEVESVRYWTLPYGYGCGWVGQMIYIACCIDSRTSKAYGVQYLYRKPILVIWYEFWVNRGARLREACCCALLCFALLCCFALLRFAPKLLRTACRWLGWTLPYEVIVCMGPGWVDGYGWMYGWMYGYCMGTVCVVDEQA